MSTFQSDPAECGPSKGFACGLGSLGVVSYFKIHWTPVVFSCAVLTFGSGRSKNMTIKALGYFHMNAQAKLLWDHCVHTPLQTHTHPNNANVLRYGNLESC